MKITKILLKKENFFLFVFSILAEYLSFFAAKGDALFLGSIFIFSIVVFYFLIQFHFKQISRVKSLFALLIFLSTIAATAVLVYTFFALFDSIDVFTNHEIIFGHNIFLWIIGIIIGLVLSLIFSSPLYFSEGNPLR